MYSNRWDGYWYESYLGSWYDWFDSEDEYSDSEADVNVDAEDEFGNSAESSVGLHEGRDRMSAVTVGQRFSTGNAVVGQAVVGTVFVKTASGLEVVEVPKPSYKAGDRIDTKYGRATVVDLSSRFGELEGFDPDTQVLYVADGTTKVRRFVL